MFFAELVTIHNVQTGFLYDANDIDMKYPYPIVEDEKLNNSVVKLFASRFQLAEYVLSINDREKKETKKYYLVLKNADFTEGRGPMLVHKLFRTIMAAEKYVSTQDGIYGSKQFRSMNSGVNINKRVYAYIVYNGYTIKPITLED